MAKALIYSYYETGIPIENENKTKFKCLTCMTIGEKTKPDPKGNNGGQDVYVTITGTTSSNLITHLEKDSHNKQYKEYLDKKKKESSDSPYQANKKRRLNFFNLNPATPTSPTTDSTSLMSSKESSPMFNTVSRTKKYLPNSGLQISR